MPSYCFGSFELDPALRVLRRQGRPVVITAKILELLLALVENRARVMTKEELLSKVWSDATVEEANLAQSISVLRKILEDSPKEHRYVATIPGRGYSFVAPVTALHPAPAPDLSAGRLRPYLSRAIVLASLLAITSYIAFRKPSSSPLYSSTPLTSYVGSQICPTFAPDGERVAFAWDSDGHGNFNIYLKQLGVALPLRLTSGPEPDISPAWSPDGHTIAFLHVVGEGKAELRLISSIAPGPARQLATVSVPPESSFRLRFVAWSPDGKWIAVSDGPQFTGVMGLVLFSVETGECRRMTFPPAGYDDFSPAFSPDMRRLAFVRYSNFGASAGDLYSVKLSSDIKPVGEPERLTSYNRRIASPVWTQDGRAILFVRREVAGSPSLWRMQTGRDRKIEPLPVPADSSFTLALSPHGDRIVYTRDSENINVWGAELDRHHRVRRTQPQIASAWTADNPQFSPDGRRIAYQSLQSGRVEIWVSDRDGSRPRQLTHLGAAVSGFARWSPDGKKIVFHSRPKSLASLYLIDADGGQPERLAGEVGSNISPSWSRDGRWIYFASARTGQNRIWKMPANRGTAVQIGERSGWCPLESRDGLFLYYVTMSGSSLRSVPLSGGPEREVLSGLAGDGSSYVPANDGIYFIRFVSHGRKQELAFFDSASHRITTIADIANPVSLGLALSPQEDLLLYSQIDHRVSNLMLVDKFH